MPKTLKFATVPSFYGTKSL